MKKKLFTFVFMIFFVSTVLFGISLDDLLKKAKESSSQVREYELSRSNSYLTLSLSEKSGGWSTSVKLDDYTITNNDLTIPTGSVMFSYSDDEDSYDVTTGLSVSDNQMGTLTIQPSVTYSGKYEVKSYADNSEEIEDEITVKQIELAYRTNILKFENAVIQSIIDIITAQNQVATLSDSLKLLEKTRETELKTGTIREGTLSDTQSQMEIAEAQISLDNAVLTYENLLSEFKTSYGIDYEQPETVSNANLNLQACEEGNTSVYLAKLALELEEQNLYALTGSSYKIELSGSLNSGIDFSDSGLYSGISVGASAGASYTSSSWNLRANANVNYNITTDTFSPSVTIGGSYTNASTSDSKKKLEISRQENAVVEKQMAYDSAMQDYRTQVSQLKADINNYNNRLSQQKVTSDYHEAILSYRKQLLDLGYITADEYESAEKDVNSDAVQDYILDLEAIIIENRIKIIEL